MERKKIRIVIAMGSNVNQTDNILQAKRFLEDTFGRMRFSRNLWTEPIGMDSDKFLNVLAEGYTHVNKKMVCRVLKSMELRCGRKRSASHRGCIDIDLDLLLYGEERCHEEDWEREYIKLQMREMKIE